MALAFGKTVGEGLFVEVFTGEREDALLTKGVTGGNHHVQSQHGFLARCGLDTFYGKPGIVFKPLKNEQYIHHLGLSDCLLLVADRFDRSQNTLL
ncbi:hypothetical protein N9V31_01045 [Candidatus Poseidonia alphae]|nr:hypothetical protein [Candidatus Poseidonia alphae]